MSGTQQGVAYPRRGDVYWVDFDPARGSEQAGRRPAVIVSIDTFNRTMRVVVIAAITSADQSARRLPVELPENDPLERRSWILPFQVMTISKDRLEDYVGHLSPAQIGALEEAMRLCWGL